MELIHSYASYKGYIEKNDTGYVGYVMGKTRVPVATIKNPDLKTVYNAVIGFIDEKKQKAVIRRVERANADKARLEEFKAKIKPGVILY